MLKTVESSNETLKKRVEGVLDIALTTVSSLAETYTSEAPSIVDEQSNDKETSVSKIKPEEESTSDSEMKPSVENISDSEKDLSKEKTADSELTPSKKDDSESDVIEMMASSEGGGDAGKDGDVRTLPL